jgi:hypothetical protein
MYGNGFFIFGGVFSSSGFLIIDELFGVSLGDIDFSLFDSICFCFFVFLFFSIFFF